MNATENLRNPGIQASADLYDARVTEFAFIRKLMGLFPPFGDR